jgi:hypothetical protein
MKLSCEIFTKSWESNPSYRIYFNSELMAERIYFVPDHEKGHYKYNHNVEILPGNNIVAVEGINAEFSLGKLTVNDKIVEGFDDIFEGRAIKKFEFIDS